MKHIIFTSLSLLFNTEYSLPLGSSTNGSSFLWFIVEYKPGGMFSGFLSFGITQ